MNSIEMSSMAPDQLAVHVEESSGDDTELRVEMEQGAVTTGQHCWQKRRVLLTMAASGGVLAVAGAACMGIDYSDNLSESNFYAEMGGGFLIGAGGFFIGAAVVAIKNFFQMDDEAAPFLDTNMATIDSGTGLAIGSVRESSRGAQELIEMLPMYSVQDNHPLPPYSERPRAYCPKNLELSFMEPPPAYNELDFTEPQDGAGAAFDPADELSVSPAPSYRSVRFI